MPTTATMHDSIRKLSWTRSRSNPIARMTPISCRRSTTARALIDAESGDADDQAEAEETLDDVVERPVEGDEISEFLLEDDRLHAVLQECGLQRV